MAFPFFRRLEGMRLISALNTSEFHHARGRRVKREKLEIAHALGPSPLSPAYPLEVTITRISPGQLDTDNLASACKAVRDAVASWLGLDDGRGERDGRVTWHTEQRKAGKGAYHVEISIVAKGPPATLEQELAAWQERSLPEPPGVF